MILNGVEIDMVCCSESLVNKIWWQCHSAQEVRHHGIA